MIDFHYYLITDRSLCHKRSLAETIRQACEFGIRAVQLREKDLSGRELFELAKQLRSETHTLGSKLFINDRVDIAIASGADGVHCRENSLSPRVIRQLSSDLLIGQSVHSLQAARKAEQSGVDFIVFGPVFDTPSKRKYGSPQGIEKLSKLTSKIKTPVFAVGGINPKRAKQCRHAGAYGVAGISSIMAAENVERKIENYKKALKRL